MVRDKILFFDDAIAVTTSRVGSNVINLANIQDVAKGQPVFMNVLVTTAFSSATDQLTVTLIASSGAAPGSSDKVLELVPAKAASALTAGASLFRGPLPEGIPYKQINVYYLATTALATGKISSFLSIG